MKKSLLSIKELADELGRDRKYIWAMKLHGFKMVGGRALLSDALIWLENNPKPRSRPITPHHAPQESLL